jgi:hypothetical protein
MCIVMYMRLHVYCNVHETGCVVLICFAPSVIRAVANIMPDTAVIGKQMSLLNLSQGFYIVFAYQQSHFCLPEPLYLRL